VAEDGAEALELLQRTGFDLVVTDIQMPRVDGFTLVRRVRESAALRRLPIVVVSQYGRSEDLQRAASLGADRYLVKSSFRPEALVEVARELAD
jgi:CheY-like chemotaxis protein